MNILQKEWSSWMRDNREKTTHGIENPISGNWIALTIPEALPERIGFMTFLTNVVFLHDDKAEAVSLEEAHETLNAQFIAGLYENAALGIINRSSTSAPPSRQRSPPKHLRPENARRQTSHTQPTSASTTSRPDFQRQRSNSTVITPMHRLLSPLVKRLLAEDQDLGIQVLKAWRAYYNSVDTKSAADLANLDAYLPYRIMDFGSGPWLVMIRYAMGLHLSEEELESAELLSRAALLSAALTNDYWSWPKEIKGLEARGMRLMNGVSFAMGLGLSEEEAREHIKHLAVLAEKEYLSLRAEWAMKHPDASEDARKYVVAVGLFAAGNSLWSSTSPRYNQHREMYKRDREREDSVMTNGEDDENSDTFV
ncbi:hypothetical protein MBLNU230_g2307t1 [Neophaeotheca triangularis]